MRLMIYQRVTSDWERIIMTKEKVLKLQLQSARAQIEELTFKLEEYEERCKLLMAHVKNSEIPPPSAFKWENATPIHRDQVEAAI